jgi:iron(III) transport system substrate-binding protein
MSKPMNLLCMTAFTAMLAVAAGGAAAAATIDEIANLQGPDRQRILEEGARKEGTVMLSGGLNQDMRIALYEAFVKKYPFIKPEGQRLGSTAALQRLLAEIRAKTPRTDVVVSSLVVELKQANLAQPFRSPILETFPAAFQEPNHLYGTYRVAYHGIAYNTKLVSPDEAPKTYEDLLDPKWKGKIVWNDSAETGAPLLILYLRKIWGEEKAEDYLRKLAKQNIVTRPSSLRNVVDLLIAGEHHIMLNAAFHHVAGSRAKGAPVDATMQEPVLARNNYVVLLKTAPHPYASMLLIDFLMSEEAQRLMGMEQYFPVNPAVPPLDEMIPYDPIRQGKKVLVVDDDLLAQEKTRSIELFQKYFR